MKKTFLLALCAALPLMAQEASDQPQDQPAPSNAKQHGPKGHRGQRAPKGNLPPGAMLIGHRLLLEKYDTDGDGKLSDDERKAVQEDAKKMHEAKKAEILAKFDTDGDGKLSDDERKAMREDWSKNHPEVTEKMKEKRQQQLRQHREDMIKKFDTDGDGKLSDDERKAMRESMQKDRPKGQGQGANGQRGPRGPRSERPEGGPRGESPHKGAGQPIPGAGILIESLVVAKYDKDGDGKLSEEEIAVLVEDAKAARQQKRDKAPAEQN